MISSRFVRRENIRDIFSVSSLWLPVKSLSLVSASRISSILSLYISNETSARVLCRRMVTFKNLSNPRIRSYISVKFVGLYRILSLFNRIMSISLIDFVGTFSLLFAEQVAKKRNDPTNRYEVSIIKRRIER